MIIVKLQGGIGNQLFQFAAGKALAVKKKSELLFDVSCFSDISPAVTKRRYELGVFNITPKFADPVQIQRIKDKSIINTIQDKLLPYYKKKIYYEPHYHYDLNFFKAFDQTILDGYWQSEKYFKKVSGIIRDDLVIREPLSQNTKDILMRIESTNSVSIHIRRGDYVNDLVTQKMHGNCNLNYYEKAISLICEKVDEINLFIFSDDILWAKKNLETSLPITFVDHNDEMHAYEDLYLMSQCKHNIIANSSFSWWGAWLNENKNKIVIAPNKWFNEIKADTKDLFPKEWLII